MNITKAAWFKKYMIPGIIFQSVVIGGGYGTGKELVEFFLSFGTVGGLVAMLAISGIAWAVVCAATFEFARVFKAYDYRTFFKKLLGRFWWIYEICYMVLLLIVLAVIASSAGTILNETLGLNYYIGVVGMMVGVGILVIIFVKFGCSISQYLAQGTMEPGWATGGLKYAFYNLGIIPAVLFTTRHIDTRKEAVGAGFLAGLIGIIPAALLFVAMTAFYPEILTVAVPTVHILNSIGSPLLQLLFQITLFGTLIETGTGFIFAVTERVGNVYKEQNKPKPSWLTPALTIGLLVTGALITQFGLTGLIAQGYGTITWGFLFFYVIPVLTIGLYKIMKARKAPAVVTEP